MIVCHAITCPTKLSHSHSFNLSFIHSQHAEQLLFSCLCSKSLSDTHSPTLPVAHVVTLNMLNKVFMSMLKNQYLTLKLTHSPPLSLTLSLCHSHIHSILTCQTTFVFRSRLKSRCLLVKTLSHSLIHSLSTCWTNFVFMSMLKSSCLLVKTLSHSLTPSIAHSFTLNMLNFCFHV